MKRTYLLGLVFLVGCGTTVSYTPSGTSVPASRSRSAAEVQLLTIAPRRPHQQIGMIEAQQDSSLSVDGQQAVLHEMRAEAGRRGCDALLIHGSNDSVEGFGYTGTSSTTTLKGYRGACLVFTGPELPPDAEAQPSGPPRCIPNESRLCYGPGGCRGGQACQPDGMAFAPCNCGDAPAATPGQQPATAPAEIPAVAPR